MHEAGQWYLYPTSQYLSLAFFAWDYASCQDLAWAPKIQNSSFLREVSVSNVQNSLNFLTFLSILISASLEL